MELIPDGSITAYAWNWERGPNTPTIVSKNSASTSVTGLAAGTHVFKLTVTDNRGATNSDMLSVVVTSGNALPIANAGPDKTIKLPVSSVTLSGSGSDPDGSITAYAWNWERGPNTPTIVSKNSATTAITGMAAGTHVFKLTVTDNRGATNSDMLSVVVQPTSLATDPTANRSIASDNLSLSTVGVQAYPNPFADYIEINITGGIAGEYKLMLVDVSGKTLWTKSGLKNAGAFQQSVNTSTLQRGVYFLKVIQNNTSSVIKLVK